MLRKKSKRIPAITPFDKELTMREWLDVEPFEVLPRAAKWLGLSALVGLLAGSASAIFLYALNWATTWREQHLWVIALLPLAGLMIGWIYHRFGQEVESGHDLLLDEIHDPKSTVPLRMTPLILLGTLATHFFGGSAGREGTAVQMGGSLADQLTRPFRLSAADRRILLMAGISAGFGSVFGTPLAGAVFGLEVLAIGRLRYDAIFPCFLSAIFANAVTLGWGIQHTAYRVALIPGLSPVTLLAALAAGFFFGIAGMLFAKATHGIRSLFRKISYAPLRPLIGGILVAAAVYALQTTKYIGLGLPTISAAFTEQLSPWDFVFKFAFTVLTLGAGFKGGEVTPLFFIGAALGNALGYFLPLPPALLAGIGLVAVFAGAANTPLACTLMGMELFGPGMGVYAALGCVASYLFSGHAGVYHAQRMGTGKALHPPVEENQRLSEFAKTRKLR